MTRYDLLDRLVNAALPWLPHRARMFYYYRVFGASSFPEIVHIENTNACNAKCLMCPRDELTRSIGVMAMGTFKRIIDECARRPEVKEMHLHGFGEATLDKQLTAKLRYAKSCGIRKTYFVTTASLMDEQMSRELILGGLDAIKFSFYGATKETYEIIHRQLTFEVSRDNIRRFFEVRKALKRRNPRVTMQIVPMPENRHEYGALRAMWEPYLEAACGDHFEDFFLHNWVDGRSYNGMEERKQVQRVSCAMPFHLMQIHWNGDVAPCIYDSNGTLIMGNILKDGGVGGVWNGEQFRRLRDDHRQRQFDRWPTCNNCDQLRILDTTPHPEAAETLVISSTAEGASA